MVVLNLDCWLIVFEYLEPETRTLYNCLLVSKEFFHLSTPVLYRRPLQVFEGQQPFSPFSTTRLDNLLHVCSGFTLPSTVLSGREQKHSLVSVFSASSTNKRTTTEPRISAGDPAISLPTTANYYKFVTEYPRTVTVQSHITRWKQRLECFAESIPFLYIEPQYLDIILPMVSRFRVLHTLHVYLPSKPNNLGGLTTRESGVSTSPFGVFGSVYLAKIVQFVESHRRLYPGLLSTLNNTINWSDWREVVTVVKAMGGLGKENIEMRRFVQGQDDLGALMVSRLKDLRLNCKNDLLGMEAKSIELLKQCRVLETLDMKCLKNAELDWSSLLKVTDQENNTQDGTVVVGSPPQRMMRLKNLVIWGNPKIALEAMKIFKDTLESVKIVWDHNDVHDDAPIGWNCSFLMPRLKTLQIFRLYFFVYNLSCCGHLENLILSGTETRLASNYWPKSANSSMIPVTLRNLDLKGIPSREFNVLWLKALINLEYLDLNDDNHGDNNYYRHCSMINMSDDEWRFPYLRHVALSGKCAVVIQGQILWTAPRLEYLRLHMWCNGREGPLDTDSFLYPPIELNFDNPRVTHQQRGMANLPRMEITGQIDPLLTLAATFPALKCLSLTSFEMPKIQTTEDFKTRFFSPQTRVDSRPSNRVENGDHGASQDTVDDHKTQTSFLMFPNLEHLELGFHKPFGQLYTTVLQAMKSLPKLERVRYREPPEHRTCYDLLAHWLIEVPGDGFAYSYPNYRHRPEAVTTRVNGIKAANEMQGNGGNYRCVVEFDHPFGARYQLNPNPIDKGTTAVIKTLKKLFSWGNEQ